MRSEDINYRNSVDNNKESKGAKNGKRQVYIDARSLKELGDIDSPNTQETKSKLNPSKTINTMGSVTQLDSSNSKKGKLSSDKTEELDLYEQFNVVRQ